MTAEQKIVIIAGPNGAGKTTFAREFLPREASCPTFVNADLIAEGIAPFNPESAAVHAGRLMIREIDFHVRQQKSFAFETTLSGRLYARKIPEWQGMGYRVKLVFLSLPNVDIAIRRVAIRCGQGGHNVPEPIIRRRFESGLENFREIYKDLVDTWLLFDNSMSSPILIEKG